MSTDDDIKKLRRILNGRGKSEISDLLIKSRSRLEISSRFGSKSYSLLSKFIIHSPLMYNKKLQGLSKGDKKAIFDAVRLIYPLQDDSPEVTEIDYVVDFEIEDDEVIATKYLKGIDFDYIPEQIKKCNEKISENDFDGAITNARTLVESVCLYIIEKKTGRPYEHKGNLVELHKAVRQELKMEPGDYSDENLTKILSGVISIINGIAETRNKFSDSHAQSHTQSYKADKRHAVLVVNLSKSISEYLFLSYQKSIQTPPRNQPF